MHSPPLPRSPRDPTSCARCRDASLRLAGIATATLMLASGTTSASQRYEIESRLDPVSHVVLDARLDPAPATDRFSVSAKLAESPQVCLGDLLFRDGFEGLE